MAPQRRAYPYPSGGEPESVPLQTYGYKYSYYSTTSSSSTALPTPTPRPFPTHTAHLQSYPHSRLKRSHTTNTHRSPFPRFSSSSSTNCFTTLPNCIMLLAHSPKSHSKKSPSLSALPPRRLVDTRNASNLVRDGSMIPRLKSRPSTSHRDNEAGPSTPSRARPVTQTQSQPRGGILKKGTTSSSSASKPKYDGLPAATRSVSLQPTPRIPLFASPEPTDEQDTTEPTTWSGTRRIRGETLVFTPEHERFGYLFNTQSSLIDELCPGMSRSSSLTSQPRTPYTPTVKRPNEKVISYFPPYEGSGMYDEEEDDEGETEEEGKVDGKGKDTKHVRGSSIMTIASSAIKAVFKKVSPTKTTIPLPDVTEPVKTEDNDQVKPRQPVKLVPIPTAEWPCGPSNDKRRRDDNEEDGENMQLYAVRREGPRNKNDPEPVEVVSDDDLKLDSKPVTQDKTALRLSLPPIDSRSWRSPAQPVQSPPVVGVSSVTATAFPHLPSESPELSTTARPPLKGNAETTQQDPVTTEHNPVTGSLESEQEDEIIKDVSVPPQEPIVEYAPVTTFTLLRGGGLPPIIKPIEIGHIPTHQRIHADTTNGSNAPMTISRLPVMVRPSALKPSSSPSINSAESSTKPETSQGDTSRKSSTRPHKTEGRVYLNSKPSPRKVRIDPKSPVQIMPPPPTRGRPVQSAHYLFPKTPVVSSTTKRSRSPSPPPNRSCMVTPIPIQSGPDEEEDQEQTPKAGRGGWIALVSDGVN